MFSAPIPERFDEVYFTTQVAIVIFSSINYGYAVKLKKISVLHKII